MTDSLQQWRKRIGYPEHYDFTHEKRLIDTFDYPEFTAELYSQNNGPRTKQRLLMLVPKKLKQAAPAVAVPFYFPEAMIGEELGTRTPLPFYAGIEMMKHLVLRGYITASADSYHLTYLSSSRDRNDFQRWGEAAAALLQDHPHWTGIGKLVSDTELMIDALAEDSRVDASRIGIAGHSLGGKMAFYTGCLDSRIKAVLASDFGIGWDQTNWNAPWYWGSKVAEFKSSGLDHASLLSGAGCKPFVLLAGKYDGNDSLDILRKAGYGEGSAQLLFCNHASGHRPPFSALEKGYHFLDSVLKSGKN